MTGPGSARSRDGQAIEAVLTGKPVRPSDTKPYGCSVDYKD